MGRLFQDSEDDGFVVKLRGLPWATTVDEILKFFEGVKVRNGRAGVQVTIAPTGRPSGEAFVEVEDEEDMEKALSRNKEHLGHRYIEVFKVSRQEMDYMLERTDVVEGNAFDEGCVRLRGLPFECTKDEISEFFSGLEIIPSGITIVEDPYNGRPTGEAYVQFVDKEAASQALQKHKEKIGHRYIEIFKSSLKEIRASTQQGGGSNNYVDKMRSNMGGGGFGRPAPYDRGDRFGGPNRFGGGPMRGGRGGFQGGFSNNGWNDRPSGFGDNRSGGFGENRAGGFGDNRAGGFGENRLGGFNGNQSGGFNGNQSGGFNGNQSGGFNDRPSGFGENRQGGFGENRPGGTWSSEGPPQGGGGHHTIHMRGLPFRATQKDIADFFKPINPVNIDIGFENGRPSGEANVDFATHSDALEAMSKDRTNMQHRYIELFLNSSSPQGGLSGRGRGGPGRFGNNRGSSVFDRRPSGRGNYGNNFSDY